jgi:PAS domain S-box-containing protein
VADREKKDSPKTVQVPTELKAVFAIAEEVVSKYFRNRKHDPEHGTIEIFDERYVLVRTAALSVEFFRQIELFFGADQQAEADRFARDFLFDLAHSLGKSDARNFHEKMNLVDPIEKLSAGPIHFSHCGWAKVDISVDSRPVPSEEFYLIYDHPFSFESDSWLRAEKTATLPVCIMNAGYSSGWCEESFGITLVSSEIQCRARGDECCRFIMAPPTRIEEHIHKYFGAAPRVDSDIGRSEIPEFFARKRAEDELRKSEKKYRALFEAMTEGLVLFEVGGDPCGKPSDLRCLEVNPAFECQTGLKAAEVIEKTIFELFPQIDPAWAEQIRIVDRTGAPKRFGILPGPLGRWFEISAYQVEPRRVAVLFFDVTERKQADEVRRTLDRAQAARTEAENGIRLRDDFISIASHELKTPITALQLQFHIIPKVLREVVFPEKEKFFSLFNNSLRQLEQFSKLVDELLDVSRISAGRLILETEQVSLSRVVSQVIEQFQSELDGAGCVVTATLDSAVLGCWDPSRIEQIIVNLLTNAMRYGAGKPIEITTQVDGELARLVIRDHGIGIAKEAQAKIFERFERAAPVTRYRGLGLGLYITRQIIQAHGGTIRVESEPGKGSVFFVELPLRPDSP